MILFLMTSKRWFGNGVSTSLWKLVDKKLKQAFQKIKNEFSTVKDELDDHREAINQHDQELKEIYLLVEKMMEKQEEQQLILGNTHFFDVDVDLTAVERRILMLLYTTDYLLSLKDISVKLGVAVTVVEQFMDSLLTKGIPLLKQKSLDDKTYIQLDPKFKEMQAKKNILKMNKAYAQQFAER